MGIHGLSKLLSDECPSCMKEVELASLTGRKVAVDASMAMYQFLIAVRSAGEGAAAQMLTNEAGEVTSHIQGMFNRTIRMLSNGVKPCYIFDGKPPQLKGGELAKRSAKRDKAEADFKAAEESGTTEDVDKFSKRLVKVTRQHNEDCKKLLRLMGVPVVDASSEAEAQCADLSRAGIVYGTATEDMDALTFKTPKLLRKMTFSGTKQPIVEVDYEKVIGGLGLTHEQFVDLCILCGCDYTGSIKGIGPKKALGFIRQMMDKLFIIPRVTCLPELVQHALAVAESWALLLRMAEYSWLATPPRAIGMLVVPLMADQRANMTEPSAIHGRTAIVQYGTIEAILKHLDTSKYGIPEDWMEQGSAAQTNSKDEAHNEADGDGTTDEAQAAKDMPDGGEAGDAGKSEDAQTWEPMYKQARNIFLKPEVHAADTYALKWMDPDEEGLTKFLVEDMGFAAERVATGIKKLKDARGLSSQKRMDSFFRVVPNPNAGAKRKPDPKGKQSATAKKGKTGPFKRK